MRNTTRLAALAAASLLTLSITSTARADVAGAKGYVKEAEDLIERQDYSAATGKLELADAELDGVAAGDKAAVAAAIAAAKDKIANMAAAADKPKYTRKLDNAMREAEGSIGNLVTWQGAERELTEILADPKAKAALGAEQIDAAAKKFATFKKLNMKKAGAQLAEQMETNLANTEKNWAEAKTKLADANISPNSRDSIADDMTRDLDRLHQQLKRLPADDEKTKGFTTRVDTIGAEVVKLALAGKMKEVSETLARQIDLYKDDWGGYEAETAGPTWEQYTKESSEKMSAFLAPKTRIFVMRMTDFAENAEKNEDYKAVQSDPSIKATMDGVRAKRDAAAAKLVKLITPVVDAALKSDAKDASSVDKLKDDVRVALGEKSPEYAAMQERLTKKMDATAAATTGADAAKVKLAADLHAKALEAWPKLYGGIPYDNQIDLSNPGKHMGKNIGFIADNLMGYRFKPGDFYYATTIGGIPVAAKFAPELMNQIKATEAAIGRGLGDNDDDGKWDVIATVTNQKTKLLAKRTVEGTGKVDNVDVKFTGEYAEPVDAIVIEVVAAKCGPFAGAKDRGVLKTDGSVGR